VAHRSNADVRGRRVLDVLRRGVANVRAFGYSTPQGRLRRQTEDQPPPTRRIGIALGGGFARGFAHIGVLKVLVDNCIPIHAVAGVSMGSIVAAAFAAGATVEQMAEAARHVRWGHFARWTVDRLGLASNWRMNQLLRELLRCSAFEELSMPLAVVASDIATGEAVVFRHGDLIPPLRASCSFPGLFTPIAYQGRLLVDGALVSTVPAGPLREFEVDCVIGVHLKNGAQKKPSNLFQVIDKAFQIAGRRGEPEWRRDCDILIEPDTREFGWDDFKRCDEIIQAGERAAWSMLPALRALAGPRQGARRALGG